MSELKKLSIWGVGPKLMSVTFLYSIIIYFISKKYFPFLVIDIISAEIINLIGIFLFIIGIISLNLSRTTLRREFYKNKLIKTGAFAIVRNPLYSTWMCLIIPGIVLLSKNLLMLTCPIFMYFLFRILVKTEENYLENRFGEEYLEYKRNVNSLIPNIFKLTRSLRRLVPKDDA